MNSRPNAGHILVIGGGPAGYPAAIKAAQCGANVTLVDRDGLGGTCLHRGCIPTKYLLKRAKEYKTYCGFARTYHENLAPAHEVLASDKKTKIIDQLSQGTQTLLKKNGVRIIRGTASFIDPETVYIQETQERIRAEAVILATGSKPAKLPIPGSDLPNVMDSDSILQVTHVPKTLAVIGGGYIGLEFSQIFHMLGTRVHVIEVLPQILPGLDSDAAKAMRSIFAADGITITTGARVQQIATYGDLLRIHYDENGQAAVIDAQMVLCAAGRVAQVEGLHLENAGLSLEKNGILLVNSRMETGVERIYAAGDLTGGLMLAHKASAQGECAAMNACGHAHAMSYAVVPSVMYTFPEVASVGLTEDAARQSYGEVLIGRFPFAANGRAVLSEGHQGFVKLVAEAKTGILVGATLVGPEAGHLIAEPALAIQMEATLEEVADTIHAHPTLSETIREAALEARGQAIHIPPK